MRRRQPELSSSPWDDLARYNAEVARGIVHTEEWDRKMAEKQAAWRISQGIEMRDTPLGPRPYQHGRPIPSKPDPALPDEAGRLPERSDGLEGA